MQLASEAVTKAIARQGLMLEKNSPTILFGAGVAGMVGSTVLACRATLKLEDILSQAQENLNTANSLEHREYSETDRKKDVSVIYVQSTLHVVRLYVPAAIVGGLSVAALAQSHSIMSKRNAALTAAYAALEKGFDEYRQRVISKYGEDEDRNLRYGAREIEIVENGPRRR